MLTSPFFLIGLLAVGIPIAIHLLQLRRYKKVYFSNVEMLEALQDESRKQNNLRRRLILAARILAIVFLVLAFCQPVIPNKKSKMLPGGTAVSVYIDNSYSMECGGMDGSLVESAKQKAREIAQGYKPSDQFQLLTNDATGVQFRWMSLEEFLAAVDEIQPSAISVPLSTMAQRQNEFVRRATAANRHIYVISDFQKSTADIANYPTDSTLRTTMVPLTGSDVANIYIDSISFDSPVYYEGAAAHAQVWVRNDGDKPVERLPLRLFVGGKQRALTSIDLAPHGSETALLTFSIDNGDQQGYVEITDYPITFDDKMYFSLTVNRDVSMLVIGGREENEPFRRLFRDDTLVRYHRESEAGIDFAHIEDHQFLVVDELYTITSGLQQALLDFVGRGGSLLVIPPAGADVASYNRLLSSLRGPALGSWDGKKVRVEQVYQEMSLFRGVFQGKSGEEIDMPTVEGHYAIEAQAASVAQPVLVFPDGKPYLSATPVQGGGWCYLVAAPLRKEHTDFVQQALFVPTIYNMALFSMAFHPPYHMLSGTAPIALTGRYEADDVAHLRNAEGTVDVIPDLRTIDGRPCWVPHGEVTEAGNYRMETGSENKFQSTQPEWVSMNYSRSESDLSYYSASEVKKLVKEAGLDYCEVVPTAKKSMTDYIRQHNDGTPLCRWCIVLCLICLLAEILLIRMQKGIAWSRQ